ncbi:MAG: sortase [Candidatus Gracilibacteria bacterium]|nr:sortase [Candidatus Gracilibacteria bacterium]
MSENKDILNELDFLQEIENHLENDNLVSEITDNSAKLDKTINYRYEVIVTKNKVKKQNVVLSGFIFLIKYLTTSSVIFGVLLITTNYSAYMNMAQSYLMKDNVEKTTSGLLNSVEAAKVSDIISEKIDENQEEEKLSIKKYKKELDAQNINLNIDIAPYTNRLVIPKIGKNIPLLDVQNKNIEGQNELNDIFMKELENGIIRYPGSAKPGEEGVSFIFGHSSNLPWMKGDYNSVFATLDNVAYDDEIIVYYGQEKYTYKIREKKVIRPGDVSVLKRNNDKSEISLMTCWPVGTTLNRLIVTGELVKND